MSTKSNKKKHKMEGDERYIEYPERFIIFQNREDMLEESWKEDEVLKSNYILLDENLPEITHMQWINETLYINHKPVLLRNQVAKKVNKFFIFYLLNCHICGDEVYWRTYHQSSGHHRHAKWITQFLEAGLQTNCLELVVSGFQDSAVKGHVVKIHNKDKTLSKLTIQFYNPNQEPILVNQVYV